MRIKRKYSLSEIFLAVIFLWSFTDLLGNYTGFAEYLVMKYLKNIVKLLLIRFFAVLLALKYSQKSIDLIKSFLLILLAELSLHFSGYDNYLVLLYVLAAGKKLNADDVIEKLFCANVLAFCVTTVSALLGIIPNISTFAENGARRLSLGFTHPNTAAIVVVQIVSILWCSRKRNTIKMLSAIFGFCLCYFICYSRTASLVLVALLLFQSIVFIVNKIKGRLKVQLWKCVYILGGLAFTVILVSFAIASGMLDLNNYDALLSGRIRLIQRYYSYYKVTLWGQRVLLGSRAYALGMSTLDNAYVFLLLTGGVVIFCLYICAFIQTVRKLVKQRANTKLLTFIQYALYGLSETVAVRFIFNFSLILFNNVLWQKGNEDGKQYVSI